MPLLKQRTEKLILEGTLLLRLIWFKPWSLHYSRCWVSALNFPCPSKCVIIQSGVIFIFGLPLVRSPPFFYSMTVLSTQCSNCREVGGLNPPTSTLPTPYLWSKFDPGRSSFNFQPRYLSFAEVGMLLDSHFLLMQFLNIYSIMIWMLLLS